MKPRKVGIIGMGTLGSAVALALVLESQADELVLVDVDHKKATEQVALLAQRMSYLPRRRQVVAGGFADLADAEIVLISLDTPMTGISKTDIQTGASHLNQVIGPLKTSGFDGLIINLTEPTDAMTLYLQHRLAYPATKVFSLGSLFASAHLRYELSQQLGVNHTDISAMCLGAQGFSLMIPWSHVTIAGQGLDSYLKATPEVTLNRERVLSKIRKTNDFSSTQSRHTASRVIPPLLETLQAIFQNEQKVLPLSVKLSGEFNQSDVYCSAPAMLGAQGISRILPWELPLEEQIAFQYSCLHLRENYRELLESLNNDKTKL